MTAAARHGGPLYVAIDQGGHATRAVALDATGREQASAFVPVDTRRPGPDRVEHPAEPMAQSLGQALAALAGKLGERTGQIVAAGLATQRSSIACWHRADGRALSEILSWQDLRAADWLATLNADDGEVRRITGLRLSGHYGASKLHWCLAHLPGVAAAAKDGTLAAGPLAAFLMHRMADERPTVCDPVNASRTLLCERGTSRWSPQMLQLFDIPERILPRIVPNAYRFGTVALGANRVPLTVCTGDQPAALFAGGRPRPRCAYVNAGTGAFVQVVGVADGPATARLLASRIWQDRDGSIDVLEGTINGAGAAIRVVAGELSLPMDTVHRELDGWLRRETDPPLYINAVSGLAAPHWRSDITSGFVGDGSPAAKIAAVAESIAFLVGDILAVLASQPGAPESIVMTGGLAKVDAFCQRVADVTGLDVTRPDAGEATARGLGFLVAGQPGDWPAPASKRFAPDDDVGIAARYTRWRNALGERLSAPAPRV